jgi:hypothetical protein
MENRQYCVYNQTSECFLSLGVTVAGKGKSWLKTIVGKAPREADEGRWITHPGWIGTLGTFSARDLIYLDDTNKVLATIEHLPPFGLAPRHRDASSILELPPRTIAASQTHAGHQLVISGAEEMVFRLRTMPAEERNQIFDDAEGDPDNAGGNTLPGKSSRERRIARRVRWPRLVAYDANGTEMPIHGIRDISVTGLYLLTGERWPVGAEVRMSLQRTDGLDDHSMIPITVDLRVARWGDDGIGLEFLQPNAEQIALTSLHVR